MKFSFLDAGWLAIAERVVLSPYSHRMELSAARLGSVGRLNTDRSCKRR